MTRKPLTPKEGVSIFHFHWWRDTAFFGSLFYPVPIQSCRCGMVRKWITPEAASVHWPDEKFKQALADSANRLKGE